MSNQASPVELSAQLLKSEDHDNEVVLAETEDFLDDESMGEFDVRFASIVQEFSEVEEKLIEAFGKPAFTGDDKQPEFPKWAASGHRLAYWNVDDRILYLHITQTDKELPLELTLGVVDGPPDEWFIGFNPFDAG